MPYDLGPETNVPRGAANLLRLADYLERLPPERYNHLRWMCGTTGCALGHAGTAEMFAFTYDEKLALTYGDGLSSKGFKRLGGKRPIEPITLAMETFQLGETTARWLFGCDTRPPRYEALGPRMLIGRREVIDALRAVAARKIAQAVAA